VTAVGILHPGAMGVSVAAACTAEVIWCADGRSTDTAQRADRAGLTTVATMDDLVERSDVIVSVCPPGSAIDVADSVRERGFDGIYVDANAIAPDTARAIAARFARFVDGGIIGPPATRAGITRLYLSGDDPGLTRSVAELWAGSVLDARPIDGGPGAASALKVAYALWTKVSSSMLLAVRALASSEGIEEALLAEWEISQPGTAERSELTATMTAPKAWRFVGEMEQIAATLAANGLPTGFGDAAADIYARVAALRDQPGATLADVLDRIERA
jgi:3-hydroxyisobutyrate dehydrogenase-like beta-hydroxyacid dehydrogenase